MSVESSERELTRILTTWGATSTVVGSAMWLAGARTGRRQMMRFGRQSAMWGVADLAIAAGGTLSRRRRGVLSAEEEQRKAGSLRTLLLVNAGADIGYIALGATVWRRTGHGGPERRHRAEDHERTWWGMGRGDAAAIISQGAFLLVLDSTFALRVTRDLS